LGIHGHTPEIIEERGTSELFKSLEKKSKRVIEGWVSGVLLRKWEGTKS